MSIRGWAAGIAVLVLVLSGCGGESTAERPSPATSSEAGVQTTPDVLSDRYDRLVDSIYYDRLEADIAELPPGDRALYVLFTVDSEINNGGFSQYLFNPTAVLHDEAVEGARLVGATETEALLNRLPGVLGVESISADRAERMALLDRLRPEQQATLAAMDEEWYAGISDEIYDRLLAYLKKHPEAFAQP